MKIESLILKNWAGHASKELVFEGSIIGFSGENGSGKTTILEAIDYSIRGKLPQKRIASERIRDYGLAGGASFAEVTSKFSRHSKSFEIYRKLAVKGSERLLTLDDGSTYTYAEQVDEQVGNILGTDVDTLANILFIPQGDLKNILFGTTAEQEKLLIKILDVGHLRDAYEALSKKINYLNGKINPNIETQISEINFEIEQKEAGISSMRIELDSLPRIDKDLLQQCFVELRMLEILDETFRNENMEMVKLRERSAVLNPSGDIEIIRSKSHITEGSSLVQTEIKKLQDTIYTISSFLLPLVDQIQSEEIALNSLKALVPSWDDSKINLANRMFSLGLEPGITKQQVDSFVYSKQAIPELERKFAEIQLNIEDLDRQIIAYRKRHVEVQTRIKALHIYESEICGDLNCTMCGSVVSAERVQENKQQLAELKSELEKIVSEGTELSSLVQNEKLELIRTETEIIKLKGLKQFDPTLVALISENPQLHEELPTINKTLADIREYTRLINDKNTNIARLLSSISHTASANSIDSISTLEELAGYKELLLGKVRRYTEEINSLRVEVSKSVSKEELTQLEQYDAIQVAISKLEEKSRETATRIQNSEDVLIKNIIKFPLQLENVPQLRDKVDSAKAASERYDFVMQNLKIAEAMISQLIETRDKLLKEKNSYAPILSVIKDLTDLKDAFNRDGLAQTYITAKFENLISATKENLKKLNVSFEIRQDPDKPLSFQYLRHDTGSSNWLPQSLMSGGQRVRLCLAFIMAVQQVLVPNLGFIILDEPSNHVDETGTADLRDFFLRIRPELDVAGMQLIVCDHKEMLSAAYTTHIRL